MVGRSGPVDPGANGSDRHPEIKHPDEACCGRGLSPGEAGRVAGPGAGSSLLLML